MLDILNHNSYFCQNKIIMGNWSDRQEVKKEIKESAMLANKILK